MSVPPPYADLGKAARDLFGKGFNYGFYKLEAKTKTNSDIEFTTNCNSNHDSGKFVGSIETKYKWKKYGLTLSEKWTTENTLGTEVSVDDQLAKGLKLAFETQFVPQTGKKNGKVKTEYKRDYVHGNVDVDFDFAGPVINGSWVLGYNGWLGGYQMSFDTAKSKLVQNNFAVGYSKDDITIHAAVNDGQEFSGSIYQKVTDKLEAGAALSWSGPGSANGNTRFGIATKYLADDDSTFRMKLHNNGQLGLAYQQKLRDGISLTLSSLIECKTFNQGGHKIGFGLDFDA
jgi:voltage-dependent anion channel protein 2